MFLNISIFLSYILLLTEASSQPDIRNPYLTLFKKTPPSHEDTYSEAECDAGDPLLLTPLIKEKKLKIAKEAAYVNPKILLDNVESYSGYLTVNEEHKSNLWFWYFPVMNKSVENTPLLLWLQGGPGASSLYGLFNEVGPFIVNKEMKLERRQHSWSHDHSLLFIDNPVGTGFSFSNEEGYATNQTTIGENLYSALQQFMTMFPEHRKTPLFITGESYAGKHIPSLGIQIHWHKNTDESINLQGLSIGNGYIDPISLLKGSYFYNEVGLIDDETAAQMQHYENITAEAIKRGDTIEAYHNLRVIWLIEFTAMQLSNPYNYLLDKLDENGPYVKFVQQNEIKRALHVGCSKFNEINNVVYNKLIPDFANSAKEWLEELLEHYRVMLYNGHLDTVVPYHCSVNTYNSLSFSGASKFKTGIRDTWYISDKIAGYFKKADNLLEVMVRGAGHMVPEDKPEVALNLITDFVNNDY